MPHSSQQPTIPYDPSRAALLTPAAALHTLFARGTACTIDQLAVEAARLAYLKAERAGADRDTLIEALDRVGFGPAALFDGGRNGGQGFGALRNADGTALVAFRGTQPDEITDIQADLAATLVPWTRGHDADARVHRGFAERFDAMHDDIAGWLAGPAGARKQLVLCGHSLGGALATLAASVWQPGVLATIGSPRVGNAAFANQLAGIDIRRYVDCCDIVAQVPPALPPSSPFYVHAGTERYIASDGTLRLDADADFIAQDRMKARVRYIVEEGWKAGAVLLRDLADHAPINYGRALFP